MKTTMDSTGRLVIPRDVRRQANLKPGTPLEVHWQEGKIVIEPEPMPVRLMRRGRLLVAVPQDSSVEPLTADAVEQAREALLDERSAPG